MANWPQLNDPYAEIILFFEKQFNIIFYPIFWLIAVLKNTIPLKSWRLWAKCHGSTEEVIPWVSRPVTASLDISVITAGQKELNPVDVFRQQRLYNTERMTLEENAGAFHGWMKPCSDDIHALSAALVVLLGAVVFQMQRPKSWINFLKLTYNLQ